jgi:4-amino-4-deoxy-L-arabinose transferase-like glycosyltransferase
MELRRIASPQLRPLLLLLVAAAIVGAAWALIVPAWQAPDEHSHFGYAQTLAEQGAPPASEGDRRYSTEQERAALASGSDQLAANLFARPEWSEAEYERWRRLQAAEGDAARADGDGTGPEGSNSARTNPPLYYAFEAIPYHAASATDLFGRLYLMRLWSALLLLVAAAATWALVGELLGPRRGLQLAGAAVVALQPMAVFISASINPDAMLIPAFATTLWLGVRVIRRGLTVGNGAALCAAAAVAILAKATGYALLPGVFLALAIGAYRAAGGLRIGSLVKRSALPLLVLAAPVGAWLAYARLSDRPAVNQVGVGGGADIDHAGLFSYLWQFYLPHLPGQMPLPPGFPSLPARDFWIEGFWGKFGWLEIVWPKPLYLAVGALTAAAIVGAAVALVRSGLRRHAAEVAFLVLVALSLLGGLHLTEYRILADQNTVFNQGRYLLPLLPLLAIAVAAALSLAREKLQQALVGGLVGFLFVLQVVSLAIVGARFYA